MTPERRGEFYFHDATICLQGWQIWADSAKEVGLCIHVRCLVFLLLSFQSHRSRRLPQKSTVDRERGSTIDSFILFVGGRRPGPSRFLVGQATQTAGGIGNGGTGGVSRGGRRQGIFRENSTIEQMEPTEG